MTKLVNRCTPSTTQIAQRYYSHDALLTIGEGGFDRKEGMHLEERMQVFQECAAEHFACKVFGGALLKDLHSLFEVHAFFAIKTTFADG